MRRTTRFATAGAVVLLTFASGAQASHFRGATLIPSVDASGLLTVEATSFWRINSPGSVSPTVTSVGSMNLVSTTTDTTTDVRRAKVTQTFTLQLGAAGSYDISAGGCCWVADVPNAAESSFSFDSTIVWDGTTATTPINFALENVQQEMGRDSAYADNLDVTGPNTYSYTEELSESMSSQLAGYDIDSAGNITVPLSTTSGVPDNPNSESPGADAAFSGRILSSDGSDVEFVWLFDAVNVGPGVNNAPDVADVVINATVGDLIDTIITATDPDGDPITLILTGFSGPSGAVATATFTDNGDDTGQFVWDSTGFATGLYIASIQGSDGSLTDIGSIRINLTNGTPAIPLPATGALLLTGLAALGVLRRRRRAG